MMEFVSTENCAAHRYRDELIRDKFLSGDLTGKPLCRYCAGRRVELEKKARESGKR